jgi:L-malate glycosyltransferase
MNIGIICYPTYGGSGVLATELGMALANKNHKVHFITYQAPVRLTSFNANIFYHEVKVPTYPLFDFPPYESALASCMVDVMLNQNLDLLHVHYAIPHASAAYIAQQICAQQGKHVPFITTLHGTDITLVGRDKMYEPVVTFSINKSNAITAVSNNLKNETFNNFNIVKDIEVIYNFVDFNRFHKKPIDAFKQAIAPNGEKILLHASNFRKVKRVEDVIKIFTKVRQQMPAKLLMAGDGPERNAVEALCRASGFCDDTRFLGKQDQMEAIFAISDLFLLTSDYESFGLSALEAMAAETPVISTNAGGLPEINVHGNTGFLSEVGNTDEMADFAINLLKNEEELAMFKKNALAHAKNFDIDMIVPQYEALYKKVIANHKAAN